MDDLKNYIYIAAGLLSLGAYIYTWLTSRSKANSSSIAGISQRLEEQDTRIAVIEKDLQQIPGVREDVGRVFERVDDVSKTTHNIDGQMDQLNRSMTVILQHLVSGDKK